MLLIASIKLCVTLGSNKMNIYQRRYKFGDDYTLSKLSIDGAQPQQCGYVLEDRVREIPGVPVEQWKIKGETAIPVGRYVMKKTPSARWGKFMWELTEVPGFTGIRPHAGNTSKDTEGCPILGKERDEKHGEVSGSRLATNALYARMDAAHAHGDQIVWFVEGLPE